MHDNFSHRPFADLWGTTAKDSAKKERVLRQKSSLSHVAPQGCKGCSGTHQVVHDDTSLEADAAVFLQAMESINRKPLRHRPTPKEFFKGDVLPCYEKTGENTPFSEIFQPKKEIKKRSKDMHKPSNSFLQNQPQNVKSPQEEDVSMHVLLERENNRAHGHSEEDMHAFAKAMKEVHPLQGKGRDVAKEVSPSISEVQRQESFAKMMEKQVEFALSLKGEYLEGHVVGLDILTMENLRSGRYSPEAHLDLHGLNAVQAYEALRGFFRSAWYKGLRTVLLVPGRGKNSPQGFGVLRDKLQLWLTQEPFKRVVLAFCTAQPTDGGAGTMYVLLRKYKKKGKINWERLPADPDLY